MWERRKIRIASLFFISSSLATRERISLFSSRDYEVCVCVSRGEKSNPLFFRDIPVRLGRIRTILLDEFSSCRATTWSANELEKTQRMLDEGNLGLKIGVVGNVNWYCHFYFSFGLSIFISFVSFLLLLYLKRILSICKTKQKEFDYFQFWHFELWFQF